MSNISKELSNCIKLNFKSEKKESRNFLIPSGITVAVNRDLC